jgi:hypothetical protein
MAKVRKAALFLDRRRAAFLQNASETIETNDTLEVTDSGVHPTEGVPMGTLSCNMIIPVPGTGHSLTKKALQHAQLKISFGIVDGEIHEYDATIKSLKFDTDVPGGKLTGAFEFLIYNFQVTG